MNQMMWAWSKQPASLEDVLKCVGGGWRGIVTKLIDDLFKLGWDGQVYQVKEKFGGLRFYIGSLPEGGHQLIRDAEGASFATCETCGAPGKLRGGTWLRTLCDQHHEERG